ncbi:hypothetical protein TKK_0006616 [Trichogramma kaykai]|uniref:YDG domain-containing protein n=1 Tax=Trichogramma kaykai TaxID=54128 RepID=A0ABD2XCF4_9HYME
MEMIELHCKNLRGRTIVKKKFSKENTIGDVTKVIAENIGPNCQPVLFHENKPLIPESKVGDCFKSDAVLEVGLLAKNTIVTDQVHFLPLPADLRVGDTLSLSLKYSKTKIFLHDTIPNFRGSYSIAWSSLYARNDMKIDTILFHGVTGEEKPEFNVSLSTENIAGDSNKVVVANDWSLSPGIRVFRKISSQSPQIVRYRYDGIYKVVAYWPVVLKNDEPSLVEWRYLLTASAALHRPPEIPEDDKIGEINGISVGDTWINRNELSQQKFHTPPRQGISGKKNFYAYSIVVKQSSKYEDNIDDRDVIIYTGQSVMSKTDDKQNNEQALKDSNKALAKSCNAVFNEDGAVAFNWRDGISLRVFRKAKSTRRVRYDGIYKVYGYWPEQGRSGSKIWQFLIVRDDKSRIKWLNDDEHTHSYKVIKVSDA